MWTDSLLLQALLSGARNLWPPAGAKEEDPTRRARKRAKGALSPILGRPTLRGSQFEMNLEWNENLAISLFQGLPTLSPPPRKNGFLWKTMLSVLLPARKMSCNSNARREKKLGVLRREKTLRLKCMCSYTKPFFCVFCVDSINSLLQSLQMTAGGNGAVGGYLPKNTFRSYSNVLLEIPLMGGEKGGKLIVARPT